MMKISLGKDSITGHEFSTDTSKQVSIGYPSHEIQVSSSKEADPECEKIDILQVGYKRNKSGYKFTPIDPQFDVLLAAKRIWQKTEGVVIPKRLYPLSLKWNPENQKVERVQAEKDSAQHGAGDVDFSEFRPI